MTQTKNIRLCTFRLGEFSMALDVAGIQEVIRQQPLTPVPLANGLICGLMNLRGKVVMVIDLRKRFRISSRHESIAGTNIIFKKADGIVSFLVDEVDDVLNLQENAIDPPPAIMDEVARELVRGTVQLPRKLLLVLDGAKCANVSAMNNVLRSGFQNKQTQNQRTVLADKKDLKA